MKKIKVLHVVIEMGLGGYENYLMNVFRHIDRDKFQFDFLVLKRRKAFFEDEIERLGGHVYHTSLSENFNYFKFKKDLKKHLEGKHYDILHCHNRYYGIFYLGILKRYVDKIIIHSHTSNKEKTFKGFLVWLFGQYKVKNKKYYHLACSKKAGDFVFGKRVKYDIAPNCIETSKFIFDEENRKQLRKQYGIDDNQIVIGHIGRFAPVKNHPFILELFKRLRGNNPSLRLFLCGDGANKEEILNQIKSDTDIKDEVILLPSGEVNKYYSLFDIFILPSQYEGFPLSLLESQASGCISLASDTITKEVNLTDIIHYLKVNDVALWEKEITSVLQDVNKIDRKKYNNVINSSIYDIDSGTKFLSEYYEKIIED